MENLRNTKNLGSIGNICMERIDKVIKQLDKLKEEYPDFEVTIETPERTVSCKLKDANIYEDMDGSLMIDAE